MQDYTYRMKKLHFLNFFVAVSWARPDASHLTSNPHFHYQIESIKPSIHIASFSVRTQVPLNRGISPHQLSQSLEDSYFTSQNTKPSTILSQHHSYATPSSSNPSIQQPSQAQLSIYNPRAYLPPEPTQKQKNPTVSHKRIYNAPIQPTFVPQTAQQMFEGSAPIRQAKQQHQFMGEVYLPPAPTQQNQSLQAHQQHQQQSFSHQYSNLEGQKTAFKQQEVLKGAYLPPYASPQPAQIAQSSPSSVQQFINASPRPENPRTPDLHAFISSAPALQSSGSQTQSQQSLVSAAPIQQSLRSPAPAQQSFGSQTQSQQSLVLAAPTRQSLRPPAPAQQSFASQTQSQQSLLPAAPIQQSLRPPAPAKQSFGSQTKSQQSLVRAAPTQQSLRPPAPAQQSFRSQTQSQQSLILAAPIQQSLRSPAPAQQSFGSQTQSQQSFVRAAAIQQPLRPPAPAQQYFGSQTQSQQSLVLAAPTQQSLRPPTPAQQSFGSQAHIQQSFIPASLTQAQSSLVASAQIQQSFVPQTPTQQSFKRPAPTQQFFEPTSQINQSSPAPAPVQAQQSFVPPTQTQQTFVSPFLTQQSSARQSLVSQTPIQQFSVPPITQQRTYTPQKPVERTYLPTPQLISHTTDKQNVVPIPFAYPQTPPQQDVSPQQSITQQTPPLPKKTDPQQYLTSAADFDYDAFVPPPPPSQNIEKKNFDSSRDTDGYLPPISINHDYNVPRIKQQSHFSQTPSKQEYSAPASPQNAIQDQNTQTLSHVQRSYTRQANVPQQSSTIQQIFTQAQRPEPAPIQRHYTPQQSDQQQAPMEQSVPNSEIKDPISSDPSKMQNLQPFFVVQLPQPKEHSNGSPQYSSNAASFNDRSPTQVFSGQQASSTSSLTSDSFYNYEHTNSIQPLATALVINSITNPAITTKANIQDFDLALKSFEGHLKDANHRSSSGARQFESQMTDTFSSSNAVQGHNRLGAHYGSNRGYTYHRK